ncbi:MAG: XdhC family protein [Adhaeribacter sp.]
MKEIQEIVKAYDEAQLAGKQTALATVVHVAGSSYRRPGARMLVTEDGQLTGAISGGCLEGDALRKARLVMVQQKAMLVTYDTTDEDDAKLGVGLGCNGIIQILIEPIQPANPVNPIALLKAVLARRQQAVLVTLFNLQNRQAPQPGTCLLQLANGQLSGSISDDRLQNQLTADAAEVFATQSSAIKTYVTGPHNLTAFVELLKPPVALVIIGAGNDIRPLVEIAKVLGWKTTIVDGRNNYATTERFPLADQVLIAKPEKVLEQLAVDAQTVFVLMTHNYNYDLAMLRQLIGLNISYIGALGPKKKLDRMLAELQDEGINPSEAQLQKIYGPTGLELGAENPEEIALSIISEIKAVLAGKTGGLLRDKPDVIHARQDEEITQVTLLP